MMRQVLSDKCIVGGADKVENCISRRGEKRNQRQTNHLAFIHRFLLTRTDETLLHKIQQCRRGPDLECWKNTLDDSPDQEGDQPKRMALPEQGDKIPPYEWDELECESDGGNADDSVFPWWIDDSCG